MDDVGPLGQDRVPRHSSAYEIPWNLGGRCGPSMLRFRDIGKPKTG